jgi:hypothetical protein
MIDIKELLTAVYAAFPLGKSGKKHYAILNDKGQVELGVWLTKGEECTVHVNMSVTLTEDDTSVGGVMEAITDIAIANRYVCG